MDRRQFLKNLVIGVAGLYVPKTLYFDMKPRLSAEEVLTDIVQRHWGQMLAFKMIGVQPLSEPTGLIHILKEKYGTPDKEFIAESRFIIPSRSAKLDNWFTTFPDDHD